MMLPNNDAEVKDFVNNENFPELEEAVDMMVWWRTARGSGTEETGAVLGTIIVN